MEKLEKVKIWEAQVSKHVEWEENPKREIYLFFEGIEPMNEGKKEGIIVEQSYLYKLLCDAIKRAPIERNYDYISRPAMMIS